MRWRKERERVFFCIISVHKLNCCLLILYKILLYVSYATQHHSTFKKKNYNKNQIKKQKHLFFGQQRGKEKKNVFNVNHSKVSVCGINSKHLNCIWFLNSTTKAMWIHFLVVFSLSIFFFFKYIIKQCAKMNYDIVVDDLYEL